MLPALLLGLVLAEGGGTAAGDRPTGGAPPSGGTCLVAGGFRDEEYDRAAKLASKLQEQGFVGAGVFDGAAYRNFATDLVVIAGAYPDAKTARAAGKPLARSKIAAYAKGCTPRGEAPRPLAQAPQRQPATPTTVEHASKLFDQIPLGCWGWSAKRATALCTTGSSTWQSGVHWTVDVIGKADWDMIDLDDRDEWGDVKKERRPSPDKQRALEHLLGAGGVGIIGAPTVTLAPNEAAHLWSPRMTVRWERKLEHFADHPLGGWDVWKDRVLVRCAGGAEREVYSDVGSGDGDVTVFVVPERTHAIVQMQKKRAEEGEYGPVVQAALVGAGSGCPTTNGIDSSNSQ
jgi:hypothetical protein